jgi:hypothetical protein
VTAEPRRGEDRKLPFIPEAATGSFAGELAVAYVFLHLLPEIVEGNEAFYGLERLADPTGSARTGSDRSDLRRAAELVGAGRHAGTAPALDAAATAAPTAEISVEPPVRVYPPHLSSFLVYNSLITYTMPL